jgi:hypothetical protein
MYISRILMYAFINCNKTLTNPRKCDCSSKRCHHLKEQHDMEEGDRTVGGCYHHSDDAGIVQSLPAWPRGHSMRSRIQQSDDTGMAGTCHMEWTMPELSKKPCRMQQDCPSTNQEPLVLDIQQLLNGSQQPYSTNTQEMAVSQLQVTDSTLPATLECHPHYFAQESKAFEGQQSQVMPPSTHKKWLPSLH